MIESFFSLAFRKKKTGERKIKKEKIGVLIEVLENENGEDFSMTNTSLGRVN